jgi:hypothetical protein
MAFQPEIRISPSTGSLALSVNVAPLMNPATLRNLSASTLIQTFGSQIKEQTWDKVKYTALNKVAEYNQKIQDEVKKEVQVVKDYNDELVRLQNLLINKQITEEVYNEGVKEAQRSKLEKEADIKAQIRKLTLDIQNEVKDPYLKAKEEYKLLKAQRKIKKEERKKESKEAKKERRRIVLNNAAVSITSAARDLAPVIALQLVNQFSFIISQRKELEKLVEITNVYITKATTPETISIAINLKNSAISLINNSLKKLENIQKKISDLVRYIPIISLIISILTSLPIPVSVPPGVGIPLSVIMKIVETLRKANEKIAKIIPIIGIAEGILFKEINLLRALIDQLAAINQIVEIKTVENLDQQQIDDLTKSILPSNNTQLVPTYKGFDFILKQEQDSKFEVKGNKRHYAVAVNSNGREILKSDYSFTLDPNDLVEQLKLIIDQQNLQG